MADNSVSQDILSLVESVKPDDPTLYDILKGMVSSINAIDNQINPKATVSSKITSNPTVLPDDVTNLTYTLTLDNVFLNWSAVDGASTYEIRKGATWLTASYITQVNALQIVLDPIAIGNTTYLVKAINAIGNYSGTAASVVITVPNIPGPLVNGTNILNTALISWTAPASTFRIDRYKITRNGAFLTYVSGVFFTYEESAAATVTYGISAIDVAGNVGSENTTSLTVTAPVDYITQAILTSTFTGALTNAFVETGPQLVVCVDTAITYEHHFTTHAWASPNDQVNAGFPIYAEPASATAKYVEVFDFGAIFTNVAVGVTYLTQLIAGSMGIIVHLEFSNDNITYTAPVVGPTAFASSIRYARVTIDFTGGTVNLLIMSVLQCAIAVHREMDGGSGTANAGDVGGTVFAFNKTFTNVESVTATVRTTSSFKAVVTAITTTQFKVLVFTDAGVRQTATIDWKARGVI